MTNRRLMSAPPIGGALTQPEGSDHFDVEKASELALLGGKGADLSIAQLARLLENSGMGREQSRRLAKDYFKKADPEKTGQVNVRVFLLKYVLSQVFLTARTLQKPVEVDRDVIEAALAQRIGVGAAHLEVAMYLKAIDADADVQTLLPEQLAQWHPWKVTQITRASAPPQENPEFEESEQTIPVPPTSKPIRMPAHRKRVPTPPLADEPEAVSLRSRLRQNYPSIMVVTDYVQWQPEDQAVTTVALPELRRFPHSFRKGPLMLGKIVKALFKKSELNGVKIMGLRRSAINGALYTPKPVPAEQKSRRQRRLEAANPPDPLMQKIDYAVHVRTLMLDSVKNAKELAQIFNDDVNYKRTKDGTFFTDTPAFIDIIPFDDDGHIDYVGLEDKLEADTIYELVMDNTRQRLLRGIQTMQGRTWKEEWDRIASNGEKTIPTTEVLAYYKRDEEKKVDLLREMFGSELERIREEMVDYKDFNEILFELFVRTDTDNKGVVSYEQFMLTQAQATEHFHLKRKKETLPSVAFPFHAIEPQASKQDIPLEKEPEPEPEPEPEAPKPNSKSKKKAGKKKKSKK